MREICGLSPHGSGRPNCGRTSPAFSSSA